MALRTGFSLKALGVNHSPRSDGKRRSSDTARKDRCDIIKAYLMDVGCTRVRGARRRRVNEEGDYETGKLDWDSELIQDELVIPLREFKAIRLDYERRSREKKLTDTTIERDWVTQNGQRVPKAKMLKNYYPTNLILHRFFDRIHDHLYAQETVTPYIESQMQSINPFVRCRPLLLVGAMAQQGSPLIVYAEQRGRMEPSHLLFAAGADGAAGAFQDEIEVDTREPFEHQESLARRRPEAPVVHALAYFDDIFQSDIDLSMLDKDVVSAFWRAVFKDDKEVEINELLSCFTERFRGPLRYILTAPFEVKNTVSSAEFESFTLWTVGLAAHASWPVLDQLRVLVAELECGKKGSVRKEQLALYVKDIKPRVLKRDGDFYLRTAPEPGVLAVDFFREGTALRAQVEMQPVQRPDETWTFRFLSLDAATMQAQAYDDLSDAILKLMGAPRWESVHQCCAVKVKAEAVKAKQQQQQQQQPKHQPPMGHVHHGVHMPLQPHVHGMHHAALHVHAHPSPPPLHSPHLMPFHYCHQPSPHLHHQPTPYSHIPSPHQAPPPNMFSMGVPIPCQGIPESLDHYEPKYEPKAGPPLLSPPHAAGATTRPVLYLPTSKLRQTTEDDDLFLAPLEGPAELLDMSPSPPATSGDPLSDQGTLQESRSAAPYSLRSASSSGLDKQQHQTYDLLAEDPFPSCGDFLLVSSTSSFGSLGLTSLAASTPGLGGNKFFMDNLLTGVNALSFTRTPIVAEGQSVATTDSGRKRQRSVEV